MSKFRMEGDAERIVESRIDLKIEEEEEGDETSRFLYEGGKRRVRFEVEEEREEEIKREARHELVCCILKRITLLVVVILVFVLVFKTIDKRSNETRREEQEFERIQETNSEGERFEDKVVITIKSGHSVINDRLPIHLMNMRKQGIHLPNLLLYSDVDTVIGGFQVKNVLKNVSEATKMQADFQPYFQLHRIVNRKSKNKMKNDDTSSPGTTIKDDFQPVKELKDGHLFDKYKFFPLWGDAFRTYPDLDWYIGTEADSFVFWPDLFKFLKNQNPDEQLLFGIKDLIVVATGMPFAHGSLYVMSGALMRATYGQDPWGYEKRWDHLLEHSCCGDGELSNAFWKTPGVTIKKLSEGGSRFQGEPPNEILFHDGNFCEAIVVLHHLDTALAQQLYDFKAEIEPLLTYSFPKNFGKDRPTSRTSSSPERRGFKSSKSGVEKHFLDGREACKQRKECLMWSWEKKEDQETQSANVTKGSGVCWMVDNGVRFGKMEDGNKNVCSGRLKMVSST
ncbi:hypothetical protein IE53DRAFT_410301 [Violaceomyces palustris]|uniref:Uncharacterized protein n=1 Tax=Violaceomyces palustris TaxID=1673888 RepID=A0ACD0NZI8_9BASI|nr:hypothetical protein IE53DRAFT_410301 [Violaceomyces palustris]